jgi:predicted nucleotidyltransferase
MSTLAEILSSRVRAEIFRVLFGLDTPELHNREIVRRSGMSESAVRQELGKLVNLELLKRRVDGNRVYYAANKAHPLCRSIREIVLKTIGLVDILRQRLSVPQIRFAFVFGSVARAEETADSDIDLMVIGSLGLRKLSSLLSGVSEQLGREINPHLMTETEYRRRIEKGDHFVHKVLTGPRASVVGSVDEFEAMGGKRLAEEGTNQQE